MPGMRRVGARLYTPKQSHTRGVARHARRWNEQQGAIMATHAVTSQDFNQVVESNDLVFVDFWATWCGPCMRQGPIVEALAEEGYNVGKIDVDQEMGLAQQFKVMSIPTLLIFKGGQEVHRLVGLTSKEDLKKLLDE